MHRMENRETGAPRWSPMVDARERMIGALLFGNNAVKHHRVLARATGVLLSWFGDVGVSTPRRDDRLIVVSPRCCEDRGLQSHRPHRAHGCRPIDWTVAPDASPILIAVEWVVKAILRLSA